MAAGVCLAVPRLSESSTFALMSALRHMVGFQVLAADDVQKVYRLDNGQRIIELRDAGRFRLAAGSGSFAGLASSDAIVFAKPYAASLRQKFPGMPARAYFDYRLLIDGEFYHVEAFD